MAQLELEQRIAELEDKPRQYLHTLSYAMLYISIFLLGAGFVSMQLILSLENQIINSNPAVSLALINVIGNYSSDSILIIIGIFGLIISSIMIIETSPQRNKW